MRVRNRGELGLEKSIFLLEGWRPGVSDASCPLQGWWKLWLALSALGTCVRVGTFSQDQLPTEKKKLKIQNYTISLFWSKVFSQNLEILPNSQKFRLNSGSMCKNQPGCAQNSWNSAPPGKSGSPGREMQIFGELGFFLALQELSEFPCKMQPQVKAVLPAWLGQHKNAKQKFDFIILS